MTREAYLQVAIVLVGIAIAVVGNLITNRYHIPLGRLFSIFIPLILVLVGLTVVNTRWSTSDESSPAPPSSSVVPSVDFRPPDWATQTTQQFPYPDGEATSGLQDGCTASSVRYERERLVLRLDSCRDYTYQVGYEPTPFRPVGAYLLEVDVQYVSGPEDGYCTLLFNWHDSEHWFAFKLSRDKIEITRNRGGLPHSALDGPRAHPAIRPNQINRLAVMVRDRDVNFYLNGFEVSNQEITPDGGETRLGIQAANRSDVVRCAFDNVELLTPAG